MTTVLISPAERPPITNLGTISSLPEKVGCDVMWESPVNGLIGVQRKATMDLIASVRDGRLGKELEQFQSTLSYAFVIIEGSPSWSVDGSLLASHASWTRRQQWGVELSIQSRGVGVLHTRNSLETCSCVEYLIDKFDKALSDVSSLLSRGKARKNGWGKLTDRSTAIHVLSGFNGISTELSSRIYDHFGRAILSINVTEAELLQVPGIGPKRARQLIEALK